MKIIRTITILLSLTLPLFSSAAGLQISPSRLNFTVITGQETTQNLVVANPTADVQIYEITTDDYTDFIKPLPKSFTLESGARKEVGITILGQGSFKQADQKITTNLSIVAKPLTADGLAVGTGAKIPLEITTVEAAYSNNKGSSAPIALTVLVIIIFVIIPFFRKRKAK